MRIPQERTPPSPAELAQDQYAFDIWDMAKNDDTDNVFHEHLRNALRFAIIQELTDQQREYLMAYCYEEKTMEEIAKERGVDKSTISRTISRGMKKLEKVLRYAHPQLLNAAMRGDFKGIRKSNRTGRRRHNWISV